MIAVEAIMWNLNSNNRLKSILKAKIKACSCNAEKVYIHIGLKEKEEER